MSDIITGKGTSVVPIAVGVKKGSSTWYRQNEKQRFQTWYVKKKSKRTKGGHWHNKSEVSTLSGWSAASNHAMPPSSRVRSVTTESGLAPEKYPIVLTIRL